MGVLRHTASGERRTLSARCVVGRAATCALQVVERSVSGEHAVLAWSGSAWSVRDLGSRNGTFVGTERVAAGEERPVGPGDTLRFGHGEPWELVDAGPPVATAHDPLTGEARVGDGSLLVLPSADEPRVTVFESADGSWVAEVDGEPITVVDGTPISDGERTWVLHLPITLARTWDAGDAPWAIEDLSIELAHSPDEEHVEVALRHPFGERRFKRYRVHHYTLLVLARAWLEDAESTPESRGWVYAEDLCGMLRVDEMRLNVDIYRARRELASHQVTGAADLVQRRRGTKQVRLGVPRVVVRAL